MRCGEPPPFQTEAGAAGLDGEHKSDDLRPALLCGENGAPGLDGMREPHVAADHAVVADAGHAAENRRPGVDDDVVPDVRMALDTLDGVAVFVQLEALCAKRDALIELHVLADGRRFADDDAGAVVDEEAAADLRAGMDVDAGALSGKC